MRNMLIVSMAALGFGLAAAPAVMAAPAAGGVMTQLATGTPLHEVRYVRHHGRICYHKCYREFVIGPRVCRTFC